MGSLHNDLHSWASKARANGNDTIAIDIATVDKIVMALQDDGRNAIIEGCALLIEKHTIQDTAEGKRLVPRQEGNQDGLRYAEAIRSMKGDGAPAPSDQVEDRPDGA